MVKMPCFETSCLETGVKTLVTETGQQLSPSIVVGYTKLIQDMYQKSHIGYKAAVVAEPQQTASLFGACHKGVCFCMASSFSVLHACALLPFWQQ